MQLTPSLTVAGQVEVPSGQVELPAGQVEVPAGQLNLRGSLSRSASNVLESMLPW